MKKHSTPPSNLRTARWLSPESYWVPSHLVLSAWLEHGPFAEWVIAATRPRVLVELGTHNGYSYFAFCQAIKRLGLDTRAYAVDTWEGDDHAGFYSDEIYDLVQKVNQDGYAEFSTLIRGYFDDALASIDDGSVDLLHIDGRHAYEDVKHDYESWIPKLSDRAVVLFHDVAVRERGFGVWKLWKEIAAPGRSFSFSHGNGLGVLAHGAASPQPVLDFIRSSEQNGDRMREDYGSLGFEMTRRWYDEAERRNALDALALAQGRVLELEQAAAELERIRASGSWRVALALSKAGRLAPASLRARLRGRSTL